MTPGPVLAVAGQSLLHRALGPADPGLSEFLAGADMALTGFEGTVSAPGAWPTKKNTVHSAPAEAMTSLRALGFDALALANNHAYDLGPAGIAATLAAAEAAGFLAAGTGLDLAAATGPVSATQAGRSASLVSLDLGPQPDIVRALDATDSAAARPGLNAVRVRRRLAVPEGDFTTLAAIAAEAGHLMRIARRVRVGYQPPPPDGALDFFGLEVVKDSAREERHVVDPDDLARNTAAVARAAAMGGLVVVCAHSHHWAPEWSATPDWMRGLARALIDAGAHAFAGHGTPVFQGMEIYRGRPLFYGLGNLVFHTRRADRYDEAGIDVWNGIAARCAFDADGAARRIEVAAVRVGTPPGSGDAPAPVLLGGDAARPVLESFLAASRLGGADAKIANGRLIVEL